MTTKPVAKLDMKPDTQIKLDTKASQLASLLTMCYGIGYETFEDIGPAHRDNILWLAADLATAIRDMVNDGGEQ